MADSYEVLLAMDVRGDITDDELTELRWHLGQGEQPDQTPICGSPDPLFAQRGPAHHIGGALVAALVARDANWSLTVRQELHPDEFHTLRSLLHWLGRHPVHDVPQFVGHLRFYENIEVTPLVLSDGAIAVPEDVTVHTPGWQP